MTRLEEACERYLSTRPYSLWGAFDISHEDRRALAVEWLADQMREVHSIMGELFLRDGNSCTIGTYDGSVTLFGDPIEEL